jgi:type II secretory pathway pseudopilin PulG
MATRSLYTEPVSVQSTSRRLPIRRRSAFTLFQLLTVLAILAFGFALFMPGVAKMRMAAARAQSTNNLKQIVLACQNYASVNQDAFPPGVDDNHFSASAKLLPYIERTQIFQMIKFDKPITDEANAAARKTVIPTFLDPRDPIKSVRDDSGATNYLFNDQVFFLNSKSNLRESFPDGTSNTIAIGETLKGDGGDKAEDVKRQYVLLKKDDLKGVKPDTGESYWKENKNIAGDRCASWMDGRFLQGTFNGKLKLNDERPDVSCGGEGGVSTLRSLTDEILVGVVDGSVRTLNAKKLTFTTWTYALCPNDGMPLGPDW